MGTPRPQGDASLALSRACWRSRSSNKADTVGTTRGESSEGAGGEKHASAVTGPKRSSANVPSGHSIFASGLEGAATTVRPELTLFRATSPRPMYALIDGAGGRGSWSLTMHLAGAAHARPAPPLLCTACQSHRGMLASGKNRIWTLTVAAAGVASGQLTRGGATMPGPPNLLDAAENTETPTQEIVDKLVGDVQVMCSFLCQREAREI